MDALINNQVELQRQMNNLHKNYGKCSKEKKTVRYIESRINVLEKTWLEFEKNHYLIIQYEDADETEYILKENFDQTQEMYIEFRAIMEEYKDTLIKKPKQTPENDTEVNTSKKSNVKMPKIMIPTFSGLYTEWISFRDLFVSLVHNSDEYTDSQKQHFLKGYLTGEPEQLLRNIPISNDNYARCWSLLESRYDNKVFLANNILKRFFEIKSISFASSKAIKELLDITVDTLSALKNIGINVESWDIIIIYIVSSKLDQETRKDWEAKVSEQARSGNLPTFKQFEEFLETKFRSLEFLDTKQTNKPRFNSNVNVSYHVTENVCAFCKENDHKISNCKKFIGTDTNSRRNFAQKNRLCFNCLADNHSVRFCRCATSCQVCRRRHHSLLHSRDIPHFPETHHSVGMQCNCRTQEAPPGGSQESNQLSIEDSPTNINSHFSKGSLQHVLLATALVNVESRNGNHMLRALIDQGSQASFITEAAVQMMGLKKKPARSLVSGLGGEDGLVTKWSVEILIKPRHNPSCATNVKAYVLDKLTSYLPTKKFSFAPGIWPEIERITLADPNYHTPNKIDLLLGAEVYAAIIQEGLIKYPMGSLVAQNTTLGWILSGYCKTDGEQNKVFSMHTQVGEEFQLDELIKSFWEMEAEPKIEKKILTEEEQRCEEIFETINKRDETGRYIVKLPFRGQESPTCLQGQSKQMALRRFLGLEKRLTKNLDLKKEFVRIFDEYLEMNHMEIISNPQDTAAVYLPYHAVVREDHDTTKVRIVFDASCKGSNGVSLNDNLMVGPKLQSDLRHVIMRWRTFPICFTADIVKMYRQIKVDTNDTDFQRILWREDPTSDLKEYKMLQLTFGFSSAPYLAVKSLLQLAKDEGAEYILAAERIKRDFYMDDLMSGTQTEEEAIEIYRQLNKIMEKGGFELQKWSSNSENLLEKIKEEKVKTKEEKRLDVKMESKNKILGLTWNRRTDEFEYAVQLPPVTKPVTKRKVLADISRLYDPLGWIAPRIVSAKVLMQKLWGSGIQWDEELPPQLLQDWLTYRDDLLHLTNFRLPRWMKYRSDDKLVELHGFSDSSIAAFGAVIYLRVIDAEDNIHITLVTAKTKVASNTAIVTIPILELCGAVLATKLLVEVSQVLNIPKQHLHAWTDSEIVLAWLSSHPSKWQTYVGNRVSDILQHLNRSQWAYVKSEENPADHTSRGLKPQDVVQNRLWMNGPEWLNDRTIEKKGTPVTTNLEERKTYKVHATQIQDDSDEVWWNFSLFRLLRVVAYCRRLLKKKIDIQSKVLETEEIEEALTIMIKKTQEKGFPEEISDLRNRKEIKKNSKLTPFMDEFGLLRIGGRIQQAHVAEDQKHPILVPHPLAKLLIADAHKNTLHGGPQLMRNYLRQNIWIVGDKNLAKAGLRNI